MYNPKLNELYPNPRVNTLLHELSSYCEEQGVPCWVFEPREYEFGDGSGEFTAPCALYLFDKQVAYAKLNDIRMRFNNLLNADDESIIATLYDTMMPETTEIMRSSEPLWLKEGISSV